MKERVKYSGSGSGEGELQASSSKLQGDEGDGEAEGELQASSSKLQGDESDEEGVGDWSGISVLFLEKSITEINIIPIKAVSRILPAEFLFFLFFMAYQ